MFVVPQTQPLKYSLDLLRVKLLYQTSAPLDQWLQDTLWEGELAGPQMDPVQPLPSDPTVPITVEMRGQLSRPPSLLSLLLSIPQTRS